MVIDRCNPPHTAILRHHHPQHSGSINFAAVLWIKLKLNRKMALWAGNQSMKPRCEERGWYLAYKATLRHHHPQHAAVLWIKFKLKRKVAS